MKPFFSAPSRNQSDVHRSLLLCTLLLLASISLTQAQGTTGAGDDGGTLTLSGGTLSGSGATIGTFGGTVVLTPIYGSVSVPPAFFVGETYLGGGAYYLAFPNGNVFGYYCFFGDPHFLYHYDMGFEYIFDAADGQNGVYLYDFKSNGFFYTSPSFPFPYLYDFALNSAVYYYPDPDHPSRYNTAGARWFYVFATDSNIVK